MLFVSNPWLISFDTASASSLHTVSNGKVVFFLSKQCICVSLPFISWWALKSFSSLSAMNSVVEFIYLFSILRSGKCISCQVREKPPYHFPLLTYKLTFSTTVYKDSLFSPCTCSVCPYVVPILSGMKGYLIVALRHLSSWMPSIFSFINCQTVLFIASFKKWSFRFTACFKTLSASLVILLCVHAWCVYMCVSMNMSQYLCGREKPLGVWSSTVESRGQIQIAQQGFQSTEASFLPCCFF